MLTPGRYFAGSTVRLTTHIYDFTSDDTDPSTLSCTVMGPGGASTTYTYGTDSNIDRLDEGHFYCDVTPDASGEWHFRWVATDSASNYVVASEGIFRVQYSPVLERYNTRGYS